MKRTIKTTIKTIVTVGFIMICACLFGNTKVSAAEPTQELESIVDMTQIIDFVVNDGSLQLYFNDGTGYYWEKEIDSMSEVTLNGFVLNGFVQSDDNYIDMDTVIDFDITECGLQLYFNDGSGYYLER